MKNLFLLFISLILCGCSLGVENIKKSFENYEHYNINDRDLVIYKIYDEENNIEDIYAIAEFAPKENKSSVYGLFYQIAKDDYILLDEIYQLRFIENIVKFYENKLYVLKDGGIDEYKFDKEKIDKRELKLLRPNSQFIFESLDNIQDGYIFISGEVFLEHIDRSLKCSLKTYECEYVE